MWKPETDLSPKGFLEHSLTKYYTIGKNKDAVSLSWDMIMATMGCCGVNGGQDFKTSKLFVMASSAEGLDREVRVTSDYTGLSHYLLPIFRFPSLAVFSLVTRLLYSQRNQPASEIPPKITLT